MADRARTVPRHFVMFAAAFVFLTHIVVGQDVPSDSWRQHERPAVWSAITACTILFLLVVRRLSPGTWLILAGAAGNLLSWMGDGRIPDYLTVVVGSRWIAFNLADVAIVTGLAMLAASLVIRAAARTSGVSRA